jgi:hypothetical protein
MDYHNEYFFIFEIVKFWDIISQNLEKMNLTKPKTSFR